MVLDSRGGEPSSQNSTSETVWKIAEGVSRALLCR
jgi:hypothetical protein